VARHDANERTIPIRTIAYGYRFCESARALIKVIAGSASLRALFSMALVSGALLAHLSVQPTFACLRRLQRSAEKRIFVTAITSRGAKARR
jgi:hypothetical protein